MNQINIDEILGASHLDSIKCDECGKHFGKLAHYTMYKIKICNRCCASKRKIKDGHGLEFYNCGDYCHIKDGGKNEIVNWTTKN